MRSRSQRRAKTSTSRCSGRRRRDSRIEQDAEALVGFSYDGHPIYGPEEDGAIASDLDDCSGHVSDTADFGEG